MLRNISEHLPITVLDKDDSCSTNELKNGHSLVSFPKSGISKLVNLLFRIARLFVMSGTIKTRKKDNTPKKVIKTIHNAKTRLNIRFFTNKKKCCSKNFTGDFKTNANRRPEKTG
jgi:hypothetical protein